MFPLPPSELHGQRVLLIQVSEADPELAYFSTGIAHWVASSLSVACSAGMVAVNGSDEALQGFDPALLPRLIVPRCLPEVQVLAAGAGACVIAWTSDPPEGALERRLAFYGLGAGSTGQLHLIQGEPGTIEELDEELETETGSAPWEADPDAWRSATR